MDLTPLICLTKEIQFNTFKHQGYQIDQPIHERIVSKEINVRNRNNTEREKGTTFNLLHHLHFNTCKYYTYLSIVIEICYR